MKDTECWKTETKWIMREGDFVLPIMSMKLSTQTCFFLVLRLQVCQQKSSTVRLQRLAMIKKNIFFFFHLAKIYFYITHKGVTWNYKLTSTFLLWGLSPDRGILLFWTSLPSIQLLQDNYIMTPIICYPYTAYQLDTPWDKEPHIIFYFFVYS